jgi:ArsR family transcriptional regulator
MTTAIRNPAQVARCFHALSDETRVQIVEMLAGGERCVCDLQEALDAAQSRLSFHLKVLRDAGLISGRREGRWNHYSLNPGALDAMGEYLAEAASARHGGACQGGCCR